MKGKSKGSPVCLYCYAETLAERFREVFCPYCYAETLAERSRGVIGQPYGFGFLLRFVHKKLLSLYAGVRQRWSSLTR